MTPFGIFKDHDTKIPSKIGGILQGYTLFWFMEGLFYFCFIESSLYCPYRNTITLR